MSHLKTLARCFGGLMALTLIVRCSAGWRLLRDGKPYFIKGAGGGASKALLAHLGGNSFRTWGVGDETMRQLDEAQKLGLTVTLGIWLRHESDGFEDRKSTRLNSSHVKISYAVF